MRTILDVYEAYRIPPWLQEHQLRVAAVGKMVAGAFQGTVNRERVITTCLVHDFGSIVKFDFTDANILSNLWVPEELPYWIQMQKEFREKYGTDEHGATDAILADVGGLDDVRAIIRKTGFAHMKEVLAENDIETMIVQYADMRTGPYGILPLEQRIGDVKKRYAAKLRAEGRFEKFDEYFATAGEIEDLLFKNARIRPTDITDASIVPIVEELKKYAIS